MTRKQKTLFLVFILLAAINAMVFVFRDHFQYQPFKSYEELYRPCDAPCISKWKQDYVASPAGEQREAERISTLLLQNKEATTLEKVQLLSGALHKKFRHRHGQPAAAFLQRSPVQQYRTLENGASSDSLWCGVYTAMFTYLAWSQGITTRSIEIQVPGNAHVVSECYVPELQQWVMTDPTYGMLGVRNQQGRWLDLQSFRKAIRRYEPIELLTETQNRMQVVPLDTTAFHITVYYRPAGSRDLYYHRTSLEEAYRPMEKAKRYLLPFSWYDIYNDRNRTNLMFWIKIAALLLWLAAGISLAVHLFRKR